MRVQLVGELCTSAHIGTACWNLRGTVPGGPGEAVLTVGRHVSERNIRCAPRYVFYFLARYMFMYDVHVHVIDNYAYILSTCVLYTILS